MTSKATTPQQYLDEFPVNRTGAVTKLRNAIIKNPREGFKEVMCQGMWLCNTNEILSPGISCRSQVMNRI